MSAIEESLALEESQMMAPLIFWLEKRGQIRTGSGIAAELPWNGRWVDLAVLTPSLGALSFELKLRHNTRAIEQAALNSRAFDRSYVVTMTQLSVPNFELAGSLGIGVILMRPTLDQLTLALSPLPKRASVTVRSRLRAAIRSSTERKCHV